MISSPRAFRRSRPAPARHAALIDLLRDRRREFA
jgi:hypothetical protein